MNITKQPARLSLFHLKEAVLEVLFEAQNENGLFPDEVGKRLGIPKTEA